MDLLLLTGDIHPNPSLITSYSQLCNLGICHANARSLKSQSNLDDLKHKADENLIDIITIIMDILNMKTPLQVAPKLALTKANIVK